MSMTPDLSRPTLEPRLRDEQGHAMTPTQLALHEARKARLARLAAAAVAATAKAAAVMAGPGSGIAAAPAIMVQPSAPAARKPPWFVIESETAVAVECVSVRAIQEAVCVHYGVSLRDLLSPRRHATIVRPRQVAVYLCRQLTLLSMPKIGDMFGGRDHTTVLVTVRKIAALMARDAELAADIAMLSRTLTGRDA